jgi:Tfp pilus assembly protein PilP
MKKILILIFILFSTSVYSNDIKDPFYKDLKNEVLKRHSLSNTSPYSVQSLKLVATLLAPKFNNLETLRKQNKIPKNYYKNLALIELPGSEDHVVVYEGQKIGPRSAVIKKITKDKVFLVENNKQIIMEIVE